MTVAAVILAEHPDLALRDVEGVVNVRRLVDTAWAGGALPIVVVSADSDGAIAAALAGTPAVLASPASDGDAGSPVARAMNVARAEVDGTDAVLLWPARMGWVDAETVTTLIEAHGADPPAILRPSFGGEPGWPALVPTAQAGAIRERGHAHGLAELLAALAATGVASRPIEVGDPGALHDLDTPRTRLPPFEGPPEPPPERRHEWGSPAAAGPDEAPDPPRTAV